MLLNVVKRLKLRVGPAEEISLITFGADRPKKVKTPQVSLKVKLKDGQFMSISANVVPKITGMIQRRPMPWKARESCTAWGKI